MAVKNSELNSIGLNLNVQAAALEFWIWSRKSMYRPTPNHPHWIRFHIRQCENNSESFAIFRCWCCFAQVEV